MYFFGGWMDGQDRKQYLYSTCLIDVFGGVSSVPKPFMGLFFAAGNGSACVCLLLFLMMMMIIMMVMMTIRPL